MPGGRPRTSWLKKVGIACAVAQLWRKRFQLAVTHVWAIRADQVSGLGNRKPELVLERVETLDTRPRLKLNARQKEKRRERANVKPQPVPTLNECYETIGQREQRRPITIKLHYMEVMREQPDVVWSDDEPQPQRGPPYYKLPQDMLDEHAQRMSTAKTRKKPPSNRAR